MKTLTVALLAFCLFSCTKEIASPDITSAALPSGYKLVVPTEVYINDVLTQRNEYKDGKIVRSFNPESNGLAVFTYDDQNRTTTTDYSETNYHVVTVDHYDERGNLMRSVSNGEFPLDGGSFNSTTEYTFQDDQEISLHTSVSYSFPGIISSSEIQRQYVYSGRKLSVIKISNKNYFNGELVFENAGEQNVSWLNAFDFTVSNTSGNSYTTANFSPNIKSPYFHTGLISYPTEFKTRDTRKLAEKFNLGSNMLRLSVASVSDNSTLTSSIKDIRLNTYHFPEEYVQEDKVTYGDVVNSFSTRYRFTYQDLNAR